jgi:hypothetical protein
MTGIRSAEPGAVASPKAASVVPARSLVRASIPGTSAAHKMVVDPGFGEDLVHYRPPGPPLSPNPPR